MLQSPPSPSASSVTASQSTRIAISYSSVAESAIPRAGSARRRALPSSWPVSEFTAAYGCNWAASRRRWTIDSVVRSQQLVVSHVAIQGAGRATRFRNIPDRPLSRLAKPVCSSLWQSIVAARLSTPVSAAGNRIRRMARTGLWQPTVVRPPSIAGLAADPHGLTRLDSAVRDDGPRSYARQRQR